MERAVQVGMMVVDADGRLMGEVTRCDPDGFEVERGFFGPRQWVVRYDEVLDVDRGRVRVARSPDELLRVASGGLMPWQEGPGA